MPPAISELLTIVIPTRDRPDLLELCLESVFERDEAIPTVIVSDNSRTVSGSVQLLRDRYPFTYVRQSGTLSMTAHHNACVRMALTPWALLLHDDDELSQDVLVKLASILGSANGTGIVVCGHELIDDHGATIDTWAPDEEGAFSGEQVVLRLGLDFQVSQPSCFWNVAAFHDVGGFPDANGVSADYPLVLRLAFSPGVKLSREIVGRYRIGQQQETNYSTPAHAERTLDVTIEMARLTREIGVSENAADRLVDYMTWWIFRIVAGRMLNTHPFFVSRLCRKCEAVTPAGGAWRKRVMREYPVLFVRPRSIALLLHGSTRVLPARARSMLRSVAQAMLRP